MQIFRHLLATGRSGLTTPALRLASIVLELLGMRYDTLETFRRTLHKDRSNLLERRKQTLAEAQELVAEREPDWEDAAAIQSAAAVLDHLTEAERLALARIESSLERMERGTYGQCAACHEPIDEQRLHLVPDTDRCGACAGR
jgi:DnaK suppressor protein